MKSKQCFFTPSYDLMRIPEKPQKDIILNGFTCILDIFAGMKQYNIIILLPFLFFFAFVHVNFQPADTIASVSIQSNTCFSSDCNYAGLEIERCTMHSYTGFGNKAPQKIFSYLSDAKSPAIAALFSFTVIFSAIELFDNNSLLYNYPSHNFW